MRLSREIIDYLGNVVKDTNARNTTEAVRLIILERMLKDKTAGEIAPFTYVPAPTPRDRKAKRSRTIKTGEITALPLRDAPHTAGPVPAPLRGDATEVKQVPEIREAGESSARSSEVVGETYGLKRMNKPVFPGTREEYEEALKQRTISEGQFRPPEE